MKPILVNWTPSKKPQIFKHHYNVQNRLRSWIKKSNMFVSYGTLLSQIGSFDVLRGKTLILDFVPDELRSSLEKSGVAKIIEVSPKVLGEKRQKYKSFSTINAIVDQVRLATSSSLSFKDFCMELVEVLNIKPNKVEHLGVSFQKFAFIIHPLSQKDIFRNKNFKWLQSSPNKVKDLIEKTAGYLPPLYHGSVTGIKSKATGQEILCELYAIPATPKQLLSMSENFVYKRLNDIAKIAHASGCSMMGLGAYTKVVGDSGITVASRSPIPVTNGNSYSAASTLWAAKYMINRMGLLQSAVTKNNYQAKAAVIGATGSIGKVSTMLLATVFNHLTLVATRPDRLLELKEELLDKNPNLTVVIKTKITDELNDVDLIVTATSAQNQKILDITKVKSGAVICDCSRPLDISAEDAKLRPDVMVIESGEIDLPGDIHMSCDIGLPGTSVYACLAETALLTLENRFENYSLGRNLQIDQVKEIYKIGLKHGAQLAAIQGPLGIVEEQDIERCIETNHELTKKLRRTS